MTQAALTIVISLAVLFGFAVQRSRAFDRKYPHLARKAMRLREDGQGDGQ